MGEALDGSLRGIGELVRLRVGAVRCASRSIADGTSNGGGEYHPRPHRPVMHRSDPLRRSTGQSFSEFETGRLTA